MGVTSVVTYTFSIGSFSASPWSGQNTSVDWGELPVVVVDVVAAVVVVVDEVAAVVVVVVVKVKAKIMLNC